MDLLHNIISLGIGAMIGYVTNWIAIKMLFRPHKEVYVGKYRLPFTPGLIPKERKRLSNSVSETVSKYLLTDKILIKELESDKFKESLKLFVRKGIKVFNDKELSIYDLIKIICGNRTDEAIEYMKNMINNHAIQLIKNSEFKEMFLNKIKESISSDLLNKSLQEIFGERLKQKINAIAESISPIIIVEIKNYVNTQEARLKIQNLVNNTINNKMKNFGFFGMIGAGFINQDNITNGIITKLNEILEENSTELEMNNIIINYIIKNKEERLSDLIPDNLKNQIDIDLVKFFEYNISIGMIERIVDDGFNYISNIKLTIDKPLENQIIERSLDIYSTIISKYSRKIIMTFDVASIIKKEMDSFDTEYLEEIIMKVAKKEFSAITKLGALIGFVLALILIVL